MQQKKKNKGVSWEGQRDGVFLKKNYVPMKRTYLPTKERWSNFYLSNVKLMQGSLKYLFPVKTRANRGGIIEMESHLKYFKVIFWEAHKDSI